MKPKIRIQLRDETGNILSDRLVDQYTEFNLGPKMEHKGPMTLEVTLQSQDDVENIITYLKQLTGKLPIIAKTTPQKGKVQLNPYKEIFHEIKNLKYIEQITDYLDNLDFRFVHYQFLEELQKHNKIKIDWAKDIHKKFQWLVRLGRIAVDPINDKYDFTLMIGIRFFDRRDNQIVLYINGKYKGTITREWKEKHDINWKEKGKLTVFPKFMTIDERKRWRYIDRRLELEKPVGKGDKKFHERYKLAIEELN